jgi:hypothetical protein
VDLLPRHGGDVHPHHHVVIVDGRAVPAGANKASDHMVTTIHQYSVPPIHVVMMYGSYRLVRMRRRP